MKSGFYQIPMHPDSIEKTAFLKALKANGLNLNLSKCRFFHKKIEYLGREISNKDVRLGINKVTAVMNVIDPINVKQVVQFLGLVGYFRKFIKNFAQIVLPLTILLRKNAPFVWGQEQKEAIQSVKKILSEQPVLAIYDSTLETEVHTGASVVVIGAILIQKREGMKYVVAYYSRKTTPEEQRYHS